MTQNTLARTFVRGGRLRSGWRVTLYLACYLIGLVIIQTPIALVYAVYLIIQEPGSPEELVTAFLPQNLPVWFYAVLKSAELVVLLPLTALFCRFLDRRRFVDLGFRRERGWLLDLGLGLALGGVQMALVLAVGWAGGWLSVDLLEGSAAVTGVAQGVLAVVLFVAVAFGEELMFRGYLQANLEEGMQLWIAVVLTSLIFGVFHALNPHFNGIALLNITLAGAALSYGRIVTGNLWLPIAYHFAWNFFQGSVFGLPVSGVQYGGLLVAADLGTSPLFSGEAFGPEGGLIGTVAVLSAFPVFWLWGRQRLARTS